MFAMSASMIDHYFSSSQGLLRKNLKKKIIVLHSSIAVISRTLNSLIKSFSCGKWFDKFISGAIF